MKIDFKSKKTWIILGAVVLAIGLALTLTLTIIKSNTNKQKGSTNDPSVNPIIADYDARMKATDEKLARVNAELAKIKVISAKDNLTKYNIFGMDEYFATMKVDKVESEIFNFVNEDIYLVKIIPVPDSVTIQTYYYKDNEFTALDLESQGSGAITRYYIYNKKVIAEKVLISTDVDKNGTGKMYISPLKFDNEEKMFAAGLDNYNYSKDESIQTQGAALDLANKAAIAINDTIRFDRMEMIANKEYYIFQELYSDNLTSGGVPVTVAWICIEKETGKAMYKDTSVSGNVLITKEVWLEKNETITLKIYHPNKESFTTLAKDYTVNKVMYNKDIGKELVKIINEELGLGIKTLTINGGRAVVDISLKAIETVFSKSSPDTVLSIESLTKTIFENTTVTTIKVTIEGQEKLDGTCFSDINEFNK